MRSSFAGMANTHARPPPIHPGHARDTSIFPGPLEQGAQRQRAVEAEHRERGWRPGADRHAGPAGQPRGRLAHGHPRREPCALGRRYVYAQVGVNGKGIGVVESRGLRVAQTWALSHPLTLTGCMHLFCHTVHVREPLVTGGFGVVVYMHEYDTGRFLWRAVCFCTGHQNHLGLGLIPSNAFSGWIMSWYGVRKS